MARHFLSEERVAAAVDRLVAAYLHYGSVSRLQTELDQALSKAGSAERVYPNRIHTLLSGDATKAVNTATLEVVETALRHLTHTGDSHETEVRVAVGAAEAKVAQDGSEATAASIGRHAGIPTAVVISLLHVEMSKPVSRSLVATAEPDWSFQDHAVKSWSGP